MNKLELEYDYDTDEEQLKAAKEMLMQENISAVEFTIKEDPILLVGNLSCYNIWLTEPNIKRIELLKLLTITLSEIN